MRVLGTGDGADGGGTLARTDAQLADEVDAVFHLYCVITEQVEDVFLDKAALFLFAKECKVCREREGGWEGMRCVQLYPQACE